MRQHKKLLMILIALLFTAVGGAWAEDTFYLVLDESGTSATMMYGETDTGIKFMPVIGYSIDGEEMYEGIGHIETVTIDKSCKKHSRDDISVLFGWFSALKTINNMENLKTEGVKNMSGMFFGCTKMEKLDLSSFNTASVTNMAGMFYGCMNLRCIYVGDGWSITAVTEGINMFYACRNLPDYEGNNYGIEMAKLTVDGGYLTYKAYGNIAVDWNATAKTATIAHMAASDVLMLVDYYPAMLTIGNTEGGTVELVIDDTLPEGFETDDEGNIYIAEGTEFTVKAVANEGYYLKKWNLNDDITDAERSMTMGGEDLTISATFAENLYDLTFNAANTNTIKAEKATVTVDDAAAAITHNDDGSKSIIEGLKKGSTVTITAANGYKFRSVKATANGGESMTSAGAGIAIGDVFMFGSYVDFGSNTVKVRFSSGSNSDYDIVGMSLKQFLTYGGYQSGEHKLGLEREDFTIYLYIVDSNSAQPWGIKIIDGDGSEGNPFVLSAIYEWPAGHSEELIVGDDGASFKMPGKDITVDYEVVRDLTVQTAVNITIGSGQDAVTVPAEGGRLRIQKVSGVYVPVSTLSCSFTDNLESVTIAQDGFATAKLTPKFYLKGTEGENETWTPVTDIDAETHLPATLAVGQVYRLTLLADEDAPLYGGETPKSFAITLSECREVEVPAGEFVTYCIDHAVSLADGQTDCGLYTLSAVGSESVTLSEITGVASAGTPLMIWNGSDATKQVVLDYAAEPTDATAHADEFLGTLVATDVATLSASAVYVLYNNSFMRAQTGSIPANRAYIALGTSSGARVLTIGTATAIRSAQGDMRSESGAIYDLQGRKVSNGPIDGKLRSGVYIINGKKRVVK